MYIEYGVVFKMLFVSYTILKVDNFKKKTLPLWAPVRPILLVAPVGVVRSEDNGVAGG